jgi:hypothetical protein
MKFLNKFFKKNNNNDLTLEGAVEKGLITKEEMLCIKKERATIEWQKEIIKNNQSKKKRR